MGEGNSLCLGTGLFPLASLKPGVKLSWEPASEATQPQYGPVSAAAAVDTDPFLSSEMSDLYVWSYLFFLILLDREVFSFVITRFTHSRIANKSRL